MRTADAVSHFGSKPAIARALGIQRAAVYKWGEFVPPLQASRLHALTRGKLKYDPLSYSDWYSRKRGVHALRA